VLSFILLHFTVLSGLWGWLCKRRHFASGCRCDVHVGPEQEHWWCHNVSKTSAWSVRMEC